MSESSVSRPTQPVGYWWAMLRQANQNIDSINRNIGSMIQERRTWEHRHDTARAELKKAGEL